MRSLILSCICLAAASAVELEQLPITAVTAFKDGHAMVIRSGSTTIDAAGTATIAHNLKPVLGTFWLTAAGPDHEVRRVIAGRRPVTEQTTITNRLELLRANIDRQLSLHIGEQIVSGTLRSVIANGSQADILVERDDGSHQLVDLGTITQVRFADAPTLARSESVERPQLTCQVTGPSGAVDLDCSYLQRGLRWIPQYRISLLDNGRALVELQACIVNDLDDLDDIALHLVIGVPSFDFAHEVDPMHLAPQIQQVQQVVSQLGQVQDARFLRARDHFSNAIMSQSPAFEISDSQLSMPAAPQREGAVEDLFVFSIDHFSLAKGERATMAVTSFTLAYEDVYKLDMPAYPPPFAWRWVDRSHLQQVAADLATPTTEHHIRLRNDSQWPLTTAPALIRSGDRVLAQRLLRYTAIGGSTDLPVTTAVNIATTLTDRQIGVRPNDTNLGGSSLDRFDCATGIAVTNRGERAVRIEITRDCMGIIDASSTGSNVTQIPFFAYIAHRQASDIEWWNVWNWPWWWAPLNSVGRYSQTITIQPGATSTSEISYHFYWD